MRARVRRYGVLLSALALLAGCEATRFEQAPLTAEAACDPALAGRWLSVAEPPGPDGEMELQVSADCLLAVVEYQGEQRRTGEVARLHTGRHGGHRYAWVDAGWAHRRFEVDLAVAEGAVYLVRYRVQGDVLDVRSPDTRRVAHLIIDQELDGEVVARDYSIFSRVDVADGLAALERADFFKPEPLRFRRALEQPR
ncbi:hypothetical protein [Arenimonas fontis]|uniref:Uncharacterized protein n=1 Tax=Arenimonas fontis TaxID=2608255 RepID=A0A5B2ZB54_9GAMM|nr:hypothetical protein [Arenimonas fontis]KAA2284500.1 hypothetical protein F0415_09240 [Arenimonas fontis]